MDLHRPEGLDDPEWEAITTAFNRLRMAERNKDEPLIVGSAKELVETVAKVLLRARGTTIRNNADFSEVVSAAHGALGRQPGEGLAADGEIRSVAGAAKTIAVSLGPLRNRYGTGHGHATPPAIVEEHVAIGVDATFLWCRWALRRLEHLIAGRLPVLVSDLHSSIFTRGVLRRRLIAADLPQLPFDEQHLLGVAVGQRAAGGTFVVCEDGVDPCADDLNVTDWPEGYRAGVVEGLFLDARGYVNTTPDLAAKGARILSAVSKVDTLTRRLLDQAGQADWDHRFADDGMRIKVVEAMRSATKELPSEQARNNWLALQTAWRNPAHEPQRAANSSRHGTPSAGNSSWLVLVIRENRNVYRPRQFVQIASLPGESFFESLAEGVALIGKQVVALNQAIDKLAGSGGDVAARILEVIAREEIGKMLVLIDAARIDRRRANLISNQLKRAGDHLGKALYYEATNGSPATIGDVQSYIDSLRDSLYLDGPNGFDWVFRNSLIADREDAMYVDLHKTAAGLHWNDPSVGCLSGSWYPPLPFRLALALLSAGSGTLTGLGIINELWKGFVVRLPDDSGADRGTHWQEVATLNRSTVEALLKAGVASELTDEDAGLIHEHWTFPLYSLQLGKRDINESEIAKQQRRRERALLWEAAEYDDICAEMWSGSGAHEYITLADFTAQQREAFINEEDVPE